MLDHTINETDLPANSYNDHDFKPLVEVRANTALVKDKSDLSLRNFSKSFLRNMSAMQNIYKARVPSNIGFR